MPEPFLAWRLRGDASEPWKPDADSWWQSAVLEVAFQPGHPFVRVRDRDGVELAPSGVARQRARELEDLVRRYRDRFGDLAPNR